MTIKKLTVLYEGWGERWPLGTLADNGRALVFEYSPEALYRGLELSPFHLKLSNRSFSGFPLHLQRLPGFIADSLPDGWGMLVMDRLFRKQGLNPVTLSPLDRLAFLSGNSMGALTFEPAAGLSLAAEDLSLLSLAHEAQVILEDQDSSALRALAALGGSPHGARPKVLVHYDRIRQTMSTLPGANSQPWLVKFKSRAEHKEVVSIEGMYAQLARQCGFDMPDTAVFDLDDQLGAFGAARFDVDRGLRVPVLTLAGLLHVDFRAPGSTDYVSFLRATRLLTQDEREVRKAFERAVFNVVFHNRDDHPKNFSYRLGANHRWQLSPCYDLTFSEGPGGEHYLDVCGYGKNIQRTHLLDLANKGGIDQKWAAGAVDRIVDVANHLLRTSVPPGVRKSSFDSIQETVRNILKHLG